eukprot:NODE_122_length_2336_cov_293.631832_g99_i0.p1 GENE.NODE_122_length_2336_cov_293.631832_g99_i0~~NODE_122_length_2336_cov_293.631832_g99_i0.p1  ORF type:complete len:396 (-),score=61.93 NODE_122_length_2336_cov_293.631832_g99_i0:205-1392(-)
MGHVCKATGGNQQLFLNFHPVRDYARLAHSLRRSLTRDSGYAGIIRLRCSRGVCVKGYNGHYYCQDPLDMDVAGIDADKTFMAYLQHDEKLDPTVGMFLQMALLYTTRQGSRRIRVHTLRCLVVTTMPTLFRTADLEVTLGALARRAIVCSVERGTKAAREEMSEQCGNILFSYRKNCASTPSSGHLILPEALKLLPLYCLSLMKSSSLRPGTEVRVDERVQEMFDLQNLHAAHVLSWVYPRLYPMHTMSATAGTFDESKGVIILPNTEGLTSNKISSSAVYIMHDLPSQHIYIWVGQKVSPKLLEILFNVEDVDALVETELETRSAPRVCGILKELRQVRSAVHDSVLVVREKRDPLESLFLQRLVEDKMGGGGNWSYVEYLCHVHRNIQYRLS